MGSRMPLGRRGKREVVIICVFGEKEKAEGEKERSNPPMSVPVTRVSYIGRGGWVDLILTKLSSPPPFATSALQLSSLV